MSEDAIGTTAPSAPDAIAVPDTALLSAHSATEAIDAANEARDFAQMAAIAQAAIVHFPNTPAFYRAAAEALMALSREAPASALLASARGKFPFTDTIFQISARLATAQSDRAAAKEQATALLAEANAPPPKGTSRLTTPAHAQLFSLQDIKQVDAALACAILPLRGTQILPPDAQSAARTEAIRRLEICYQVFPKAPFILARLLAELRQAGNLERCLALIAAMPASFRPIDRLRLERAAIMHANGNAAGAQEVLEKITIRSPAIALLRARVLTDLGKREAGEAVLRRLVNISPGLGEIWVAYAGLAAETGDWLAAAARLEEARTHRPSDKMLAQLLTEAMAKLPPGTQLPPLQRLSPEPQTMAGWTPPPAMPDTPPPPAHFVCLGGAGIGALWFAALNPSRGPTGGIAELPAGAGTATDTPPSSLLDGAEIALDALCGALRERFKTAGLSQQIDIAGRGAQARVTDRRYQFSLPLTHLSGHLSGQPHTPVDIGAAIAAGRDLLLTHLAEPGAIGVYVASNPPGSDNEGLRATLSRFGARTLILSPADETNAPGYWHEAADGLYLGYLPPVKARTKTADEPWRNAVQQILAGIAAHRKA
jgi:tetratricopeptide (TPR) repeat protein